jgi:L-threonate 2-dehydrogenase
MAADIVVIAPGAMGAAVAARMAEHGARIRTSLAGRSAASRARAEAAGMAVIEDDHALIEGAEAVLSIVPPGAALALAERLRPALAAQRAKPLVIDCNAVNPETAARIAACLEPSGCRFVDGGIIGGPPKAGETGPRIYLSGPFAGEAEKLRRFGLDMRRLDGPVGAASALKMSYAGITKGLTAIGTAMILGAAAAGSGEALARELAESQPALMAYFRRAIPQMYGKAYRWVAEMEEIAGFLGADGAIYEGAARLYARLAADAERPAPERREIAALDGFLGQR